MNPLFQQAIGSLLRYGLIGLSAYLVKHGIWSDSLAERFVEAAVPALVAIAWSFYQKYRARVEKLTALMLPPGSTENDLKAHIKSGEPTPAVTTPPNTAPGVPAEVYHPASDLLDSLPDCPPGKLPPPYDSTAVNPNPPKPE